MPGYLLDTSVLSLMGPTRQHIPAGFIGWITRQTQNIFVPTLAIVEVQRGINKLRRSGGIDRAAAMDRWLDEVIGSFGARVIPLDTASGRTAGALLDVSIAGGFSPGFADVCIAAIANHHELELLTRNLRHFQPLGVACLDPLAPP